MGEAVRDTETVSPVLKVPRQCPLVLLVNILHVNRIILYDVGRAELW
jgi:hypothetical protein